MSLPSFAITSYGTILVKPVLMAARSARRLAPAKGYVSGRKNFAAISAVEGLAMTADAEMRLERTSSPSPEERRAETIRAYTGRKKRK